MTPETHPSANAGLPPAITLMLVACISLIIANAASLWLNLAALEHAATEVNQAWATIGKLRQMRSSLALAENSWRGYLLSGDTAQLRAMSGNSESFVSALQEVEVLLKTRPDQGPPLARLAGCAQSLRTAFDSALDLQAAGRHDEALRLARADGNRLGTGDSQDDLLNMIATEHARLQDHNTHAYERFRVATVMGVVIGIVTLAVLVVFYVLIARSARRSRVAEASLQQANQTLEDRIAARTAQLANLSRHLLAVAEREKAALARELHDELGSNLTAINLDIASVANQLQPDQPAVAARLTRAMRVLKETVDLKRRIIHGLRPSMLDNLGLAATLQMHAEEFTERTGLPCQLDLADELDDLDPDTAIGLFRVAQEALTNIAQHAHAGHVEISLRRAPDGYRLLIADDGVGMREEVLERPLAHGLLGMRERIARLGGSLRIHPGTSGGTVIEARVPVVSATRPAGEP